MTVLLLPMIFYYVLFVILQVIQFYHHYPSVSNERLSLQFLVILFTSSIHLTHGSLLVPLLLFSPSLTIKEHVIIFYHLTGRLMPLIKVDHALFDDLDRSDQAPGNRDRKERKRGQF